MSPENRALVERLDPMAVGVLNRETRFVVDDATLDALLTAARAERDAEVERMPRYAVGQVVIYLDHHDRQQEGAVERVEATWSHAAKRTPRLIYTVRHPTYRNGRMYVSEGGILAARAALTDGGEG